MSRAEDLPARSTEAARKARFRALVENHFGDIWRFLRYLGVAAHGVDDAVQDVFLVIWQRLDEIRPGSERAFLFTTAYRTSRTARRRGYRETPDENVDATLDTAPTPEEELDDKQARDLAFRLLKGLEQELRVVFVLYEIEGFTVPRIAELTEVPVGTVASRLRRAREIFEARFERAMNLRGGR